MRPALACELARLFGRRSTWLLFAGCLAVSAVAAWGFSLVTLNVQLDAGGVTAHDAASLLISRGSLAGVFAGMIGAVSVGSEFRHGTIDTTLLMTPRRGVVLGAKLIALSALAFLLAVTAAACAWLIGSVVLVDAIDLGALGLGALGLVATHVAFALGCAVIGAGVAFLLRSQLWALVVMIAYPLVLEPAVRGLANVGGGGWTRDAVNLLPWGAGSAMQEWGDAGAESLLSESGPTPLAGGMVFFAVVAMVIGAASLRFRSRDLARAV